MSTNSIKMNQTNMEIQVEFFFPCYRRSNGQNFDQNFRGSLLPETEGSYNIYNVSVIYYSPVYIYDIDMVVIF